MDDLNQNPKLVLLTDLIHILEEVYHEKEPENY